MKRLAFDAYRLVPSKFTQGVGASRRCIALTEYIETLRQMGRLSRHRLPWLYLARSA